MISVILAAGMAKRLRPLTDKCPKCLLKIGERSLLWRSLDAMSQAGIRDFVIVTGYKAEMIHEEVERWKNEGTKVRGYEGTFSFLHNADYENNNNIYSLWMTGEVVRGKDFLLLDSDILLDPKLVDRMAHEEGSALAVNRHELGEEEMKVVVAHANDQCSIIEISKTCNPVDAMGESVGVEKITADYSEALYKELDKMILDEGLIDVFYEQAFQRLILQGHQFHVVDTTKYFSMELDTPEDYYNAQKEWPTTA